MIAIVDYGAGNIGSVRKAFSAIGADSTLVTDPASILRAAAVVIPGVGHFAATSALDDRWRSTLRQFVARGGPLLGICLGMQWLFEGSDEAPDEPGLGLFEGRCFRLAGGDVGSSRVKVPHVGWNRVGQVRPGRSLSRVPDGAHVYFTHSYAAPVTLQTVGVCEHGQAFAAATESGCVWGLQFHPEKSGEMGLAIIRAFLER